MYAFTLSVPVVGVQMVLMNTLQAMGKGLPALIVSLSRQGLFYFSAIIILNSVFQFKGFIYAQAIADLLATLLSVGLFLNIVIQFKHSIPIPNSNKKLVEVVFD